MKKRFWVKLGYNGLLFAWLLGMIAGAIPARAAGGSFVNPIMNGAADPHVAQKDGWYYFVMTQVDRIDIWKSRDLTQISNQSPTRAFTPSSSGWGSQNIWAPELHFLNGKWYLYYTADDGTDANHRMFVLENASADPTAGTWVSKGQINTPGGFAIDGTVFEQEGTLYFVWSSRNGPQSLWISAMSNPWTLTGVVSQIATPTYGWEPYVNEGPAVLQRNGRIFITYSGNGCDSDDYLLGMLTAQQGSNLTDPGSWIKSPLPVFSKANSVYGPGHNSFVASPDGTEDWIVYHANSVSGAGCTGERSTRIQKFTWNADGTPNFGIPVAAGVPITKPSESTGFMGYPLYSIINANSGKAVSVTGIDPNPGANVAQWSYEAHADQHWSLEPTDGGFFKIRASHSRLILNVQDASILDGGNVIQTADTNALSAQWKPISLESGYYVLQNRNSGKMLDVAGGSIDDNANIQQWSNNGATAQQFRFEPVGSVKLLNVGSGKALDVAAASTADGANIQQWSDNGCQCQRWHFDSLGNGYFKIVNENSGKVVDIENMIDANGTNIRQWTDLNNAGQHWRLEIMSDGSISFRPALNGNRAIDVEAFSNADGANVSLYDATNTINQLWRLTP
ncbi:RICIN domain-containing protein [Cohnella sp. 56]|uniref:RICIN domain-containing protein n=1 Tax=Cohnella sp. 56 TaxID=3113722 RepID=UPI0030E9DFE8